MQRTIGVREAKAQLSRLLRDVQQGLEWVITDRGRPVAVISPVPRASLPLEERVRQLEEKGWIEPRHHPCRQLPPPLPLPGDLAQTWLQEDRGR